MIRALPALLVAAVPVLTAPVFAPAEGVALRYTVTDERGDAAVTLRMRSTRRIAFYRRDGGYRAELTVLGVDSSGTGDAAAMSRRLLSALAGRTVRYDLDSRGGIVAVDDQPHLIAAIVAAVSKSPGAGKDESSARSVAAAKFAATLAAMPEDAQRRLLGSFLTPVIAAAVPDLGERSIAVPLSSAFGPGASLPGRETVTLAAGDRVIVDTVADGAVVGTESRSMMRIVRHREIDSRTGLVLLDDRRTESWMAATPDRRTVARSVGTLTAD